MKILLLDDHALFRAGLRLLLGTIINDPLILEAGTIDAAILIANCHPDLKLCLLEPNLRNADGLTALTGLKAAAPNIEVVIVSSDDDGLWVHACLAAGAMSFVPKSAAPEVLSEALAHVLAGIAYLPPGLQDNNDSSSASAPALSSRQRDVLRGLCRGLSTKSIARELSLSEHTVKEYVAALFHLLDVHNRTEAVIKANQLQLLPPL